MYDLQPETLVTTIGDKYDEKKIKNIGDRQLPFIMLREFTADVAIPLQHLCPTLRTLRFERGSEILAHKFKIRK